MLRRTVKLAIYASVEMSTVSYTVPSTQAVFHLRDNPHLSVKILCYPVFSSNLREHLPDQSIYSPFIFQETGRYIVGKCLHSLQDYIGMQDWQEFRCTILYCKAQWLFTNPTFYMNVDCFHSVNVNRVIEQWSAEIGSLAHLVHATKLAFRASPI